MGFGVCKSESRRVKNSTFSYKSGRKDKIVCQFWVLTLTDAEGVDDSEITEEDDVRAGSTGVLEEVLKADVVEIVELEFVCGVPNCKS